MSIDVFKENMEALVYRSLQNEVLKSSLVHVAEDDLEAAFEPIRSFLQNLDAKKLLNLELSDSGAILEGETRVMPIHSQIHPLRDDGALRYLHLAEVPEHYSMGVFVFPPHARIPLHDHPGMCVLSRILYGEVQRTSLDLPSQPRSRWWPWRQPGRRLAQREIQYLQAPACTMLYPERGNLHEFVAGPTGAAILDVLVPPYDEDDRDCSYFECVDHETDPSSVWVQTIPQPDDFNCVSGAYQKWKGQPGS